MKFLPFLALLILPACTTVYGPSGKKLYSSSSNNKGVKITQSAKTTTVEIADQDNAVVVKEHGNNLVKGGTAAATSGLFGIFAP